MSAEDVEERMTGLEANIKNLKPNLGAIEAHRSDNWAILGSGTSQKRLAQKIKNNLNHICIYVYVYVCVYI